MNTRLLLLSAMTVAATLPIAAQRDTRTAEKDVVTVVSGDQGQASRVEKAFKENAPEGVNDNGLPRFAIVGKDDKFYLGIGAQFNGEAVYDWGDNMPSETLFIPSSITAAAPGNNQRLGFGWNSSNLYLNMVALPNTDNQVGIFFKATFLGNNNSFDVFHLYAKYRGLTVGYTNSTFTDPSAEPMTVDFEGPNGYPFLFVFKAAWTQKFTDNFSGAIAVEAPTGELTTGNGTRTSTQTLPAVPLYVQYAWGGGASHVRLSGLFRPMRYRDVIEHDNSTMLGLGVQLSGMANIYGPLSAQYNVAYGSGIGSYLQDDNGLDLDAVYSTTPGHMKMVRSLGLTGGLTYQISPKVSTNLVYSHVLNSLPDGAVAPESNYRYGDYVAANVIWSINKYLSAGLEYDYGHRKSFDGTGLHTNRMQCQFSVTL